MTDLNAAAQRLLVLKRASSSFHGYVRLHHPGWVIPPFHEHLIGVLDKFERNDLRRKDIYPDDTNPDALVTGLLVTMPPRHSKTEYCSKLFPSYYIARKPDRYVMSASYNAILANDFGRSTRDYISHPETQLAFPEARLRKDSQASDEWRMDLDGGRGGAYFGVGLGGTTSGRPANLLIVDDPIKSREEADSLVNRNKVWNYYTSALNTRLQPENDGTPARRLVILTRWHPDDLAGRLMQTEEWTSGSWAHINFPALTIAEDGTRTALWPDRFSVEDIERHERLNPREFAALFMQSPYIAGGNLIKTNWWQTYPDTLKPERFSAVVIAADTAFKADETADFSVLMVLGLDSRGDIYILDVVRGRFEFPELRRRAIHLNAMWRGKGLRGLYVEDRASGQSLIQELRRESGMSVIPYRVTRDKVARVNSVIPLIEGGRVFIPQSAPWLDTFIEETVAFPASSNDDQVDALSIGLDAISRMNVSPEAMAFDTPFGQSLAEARGLFPKLRAQWRNWGE